MSPAKLAQVSPSRHRPAKKSSTVSERREGPNSGNRNTPGGLRGYQPASIYVEGQNVANNQMSWKEVGEVKEEQLGGMVATPKPIKHKEVAQGSSRKLVHIRCEQSRKNSNNQMNSTKNIKNVDKGHKRCSKSSSKRTVVTCSTQTSDGADVFYYKADLERFKQLAVSVLSGTDEEKIRLVLQEISMSVVGENLGLFGRDRSPSLASEDVESGNSIEEVQLMAPELTKSQNKSKKGVLGRGRREADGRVLGRKGPQPASSEVHRNPLSPHSIARNLPGVREGRRNSKTMCFIRRQDEARRTYIKKLATTYTIGNQISTVKHLTKEYSPDLEGRPETYVNIPIEPNQTEEDQREDKSTTNKIFAGRNQPQDHQWRPPRDNTTSRPSCERPEKTYQIVRKRSDARSRKIVEQINEELKLKFCSMKKMSSGLVQGKDRNKIPEKQEDSSNGRALGRAGSNEQLGAASSSNQGTKTLRRRTFTIQPMKLPCGIPIRELLVKKGTELVSPYRRAKSQKKACQQQGLLEGSLKVARHASPILKPRLVQESSSMISKRVDRVTEGVLQRDPTSKQRVFRFISKDEANDKREYEGNGKGNEGKVKGREPNQGARSPEEASVKASGGGMQGVRRRVHRHTVVIPAAQNRGRRAPGVRRTTTIASPLSGGFSWLRSQDLYTSQKNHVRQVDGGARGLNNLLKLQRPDSVSLAKNMLRSCVIKKNQPKLGKRMSYDVGAPDRSQSSSSESVTSSESSDFKLDSSFDRRSIMKPKRVAKSKDKASEVLPRHRKSSPLRLRVSGTQINKIFEENQKKLKKLKINQSDNQAGDEVNRPISDLKKFSRVSERSPLSANHHKNSKIDKKNKTISSYFRQRNTLGAGNAANIEVSEYKGALRAPLYTFKEDQVPGNGLLAKIPVKQQKRNSGNLGVLEMSSISNSIQMDINFIQSIDNKLQRTHLV